MIVVAPKTEQNEQPKVAPKVEPKKDAPKKRAAKK